MPPEDGLLEAWWPFVRSLDLVHGPLEVVAEAVSAEFQRFAGGSKVVGGWKEFDDLGAVFSSTPYLSNVATFIAVLPTVSDWVALWCNSSLCDGYDALCWCLSHHHRVTTIHWSANDEEAVFQPGWGFTHRAWRDGEIKERSVACIREDRRWLSVETGERLPEEDALTYAAARTCDRPGEERLMALLSRLGARPREASFYSVPGRPVFLLSRALPRKATRRRLDSVLAPRSSYQAP